MRGVPSGFRLRFQVFLVCRSRKLPRIFGHCSGPYFVSDFISDTAYGGNGDPKKRPHTAYTERTPAVHRAYVHLALFCALEHAKEISWIVGIGDHIEVVEEGRVFDLVVDISEG